MSLAYISEKGLKELEKQGLLRKKSFKTCTFVSTAYMGRQAGSSSQRAVHHTKAIMGYVHSDLWQASRVPSHSGARHFLYIIDDYSRKLWVYILKNKNDALESLRNGKLW